MKPLRLKKIKLPLSTFWAMPDERRSALLLLGLFLNEANWLMKLLVKAGRALPPESVSRSLTPEEEANYSLVMLTMTTLVGKIWGGWECISGSKKSKCKKLHSTLEGLSMPDEAKALKAQLKQQLSKELFHRIRHNIAFHYSEELIDFSSLEQLVTERDAHVYISDEWHMGHTLCPLSTLAGLEPLLHRNPNRDPKIALPDVIGEIFKVTELYSQFLYHALFVLIKDAFGTVPWESVTIPDALEIDSEHLLRFFLHPPSNLEEIRSSLA
jgi:hypothetical protein